MMPLQPAVPRLVLPLLCALLCLRTQGDPGRVSVPSEMAFPAAMPRIVVWAWEEPEDLRFAPPATTGVAYLAETLLLGTRQRQLATNIPAIPPISILPRHQPLAVAPGASVMAVVRVMTLPGFRDSDAMRAQTAAALAEVSHRPGLRALQIDFDATRSQRAFYAAVLHQLRPRMPAGMPLSITALVSWCAAAPGGGDWISQLPIDEAVPMFFRMGGKTRPGDNKSGYPLREPLCRASIGISTDESWPGIRPGQRIYVFAPGPWTRAQLVALDGIPGGRRAPALSTQISLRAINDSGLPNRPASEEYDSSEQNLP